MEHVFKEVNCCINPPEADKGLIPRRLRRYNVFVDTPLLCGGVVHFEVTNLLTE